MFAIRGEKEEDKEKNDFDSIEIRYDVVRSVAKPWITIS